MPPPLEPVPLPPPADKTIALRIFGLKLVSAKAPIGIEKFHHARLYNSQGD